MLKFNLIGNLIECASEIFAFATTDVFLQYQVMPFGFAGTTFQQLMSIVLSNVYNCEAYLDDMVCYNDTWEDPLKTIDKVLQHLSEANLTLSLVKCEFGCATVTYLGKEVGSDQVHPLNSKIRAILDFRVLRYRENLHHFLLCLIIIAVFVEEK